MAIISFAVLSGCIKLLYVIYKQDVSIITVMNLVSSSVFIFSAAMLIAIFFSFFFVQLSMVLLVIGAIGSLIMLFIGFQKAASFDLSPLWAFLGINAINIIIISIIGGQLLSSVFGEVVVGNMFGSAGWLW